MFCYLLARAFLVSQMVKNLPAESCLTLCDRMDYSPRGSSVLRISQARVLEWVAMPSFRGLPDPEIKSVTLASLAWEVDSSSQCHLGR